MKKFLLLALLITPFVLQAKTNKLPKKAPKYVVIVGFDGMSAQSIREADAMPFYEQMMKWGSYTLTRRSVLPSSSACNWASLYMGAGPEQHGYNTWSSRHPDFPSDTLTDHGFFPDLYYQAKKQYPNVKIAHFYEWIGMHYVIDTLSVDKDKQFDRFKAGDLDDIIKYITTEKPFITSVVFDAPDHVGHTIGWMTPEYLDDESKLDGILKHIYESIKAAGMLDETLFVLTADHGGKGKGHGGISMEEMETCLVFCGKGAKAGHVIKETTSVVDIAPTLARILHIPYPHAWVGRPIPSLFSK